MKKNTKQRSQEKQWRYYTSRTEQIQFLVHWLFLNSTKILTQSTETECSSNQVAIRVKIWLTKSKSNSEILWLAGRFWWVVSFFLLEKTDVSAAGGWSNTKGFIMYWIFYMLLSFLVTYTMLFNTWKHITNYCYSVNEVWTETTYLL